MAQEIIQFILLQKRPGGGEGIALGLVSAGVILIISLISQGIKKASAKKKDSDKE